MNKYKVSIYFAHAIAPLELTLSEQETNALLGDMATRNVLGVRENTNSGFSINADKVLYVYFEAIVEEVAKDA